MQETRRAMAQEPAFHQGAQLALGHARAGAFGKRGDAQISQGGGQFHPADLFGRLDQPNLRVVGVEVRQLEHPGQRLELPHRQPSHKADPANPAALHQIGGLRDAGFATPFHSRPPRDFAGKREVVEVLDVHGARQGAAKNRHGLGGDGPARDPSGRRPCASRLDHQNSIEAACVGQIQEARFARFHLLVREGGIGPGQDVRMIRQHPGSHLFEF